MAMPDRCPNCGASKEWFEVEIDGWRTYCLDCDEEIQDTDAKPDDDRSHWIVKNQPVKPQPTAEEIARLLKEKYGEPKPYDGKKIVTDDRLYTG